MRADRLLLLMDLLRRHGRITAAELARRLEVDRRTVLRDIEALSTAGIPVYAERGRNGGFALVPGYRPHLEDLTAEETRALFLTGAQHTLGRLGLEGPLASALRKLSAALPDDQHRQVSHAGERIVVDAAGWTSDPAPLPFLEVVQRAVFDDRRLRIGYTPKDVSRAGVRTVDPYGLLLAAGTWYLVAGHRGSSRSYRVSRITAVRVLDQASSRPPDLDLRGLWRTMRTAYGNETGTPTRLRVSTELVELVLNSLSSQLTGPAQTRAEGATTVVEGRLRSVRGGAAVLAGFGRLVEVLEPAELIESLVTVADELMHQYRQEPEAAHT
ncbi:MAG: Transcriptional regulator, DeoR family [uncultured Propionibacteriaceae bacterium]|uniref:Transcriptional regulator, DeoR family n=1 Tax=uncultured Propionibacteriaceae bacterium TaxID=257457 RepID=A0A6J4N4J0_9ACTN|nr:MAG: Transcriptional regulator, DeoR family [uncultured Propionibacteriaceae bacterium]